MGKIPQYTLQGFSPTATGIPQADRSGEILGQGISQVGKILQERDNKVGQMLATEQVGNFNREYSQLKNDLQNQYRNNPKEYPRAVQDKAKQLAMKYSANLKGTTSKFFDQMTTSLIAGDSEQLVGWANQREQEQVVGAIQQRYQNLALSAEESTDPEEIRFMLSGTGMASADAESLPRIKNDASGFLDESSLLKLDAQYRKDIIQNHLTGRIYQNSTLAEADIASGKYDGLASPADLKQYLQMAITARKNEELLSAFRTPVENIAALADISRAIRSGTARPGDVNRLLELAELNKGRVDSDGRPIVSDNYLKGLKALQAQAIGLSPVVATDDQEFSAAWQAKLDKFYVTKGPRSKPKPSDYDEVLGLAADLVKYRAEGKITEETFIRKMTILERGGQSQAYPKGRTSTLTEALEKAGNYGFWINRNPGDLFSAGYTIIREYFNKRNDLTDIEKRDYSEKAIIDFTDSLQILTDEKRRQMTQNPSEIRTILLGDKKNFGVLSRYDLYRYESDIGGEQYLRIGDTIVHNGRPYQFRGLQPDGKTFILSPIKDLMKGTQ